MNRFKAIILICAIFLFSGINAQQKITIDVNTNGEQFHHFRSKCLGTGSANEALGAGWLEPMQKNQEICGFAHVRYLRLFHRDMFPVLTEKGKTVYKWQYIDHVLDRFLNLYVRPDVELSSN